MSSGGPQLADNPKPTFVPRLSPRSILSARPGKRAAFKSFRGSHPAARDMIVTSNNRVGVIVGSLRQGSFSRRVARALMDRAPDSFSCSLIEIDKLSLYNQDLDADPPASWVAFREAVRACDALLFVTPEYDRSVPGVLKNATDIGSRPPGSNVFAGKPAAVVSVSPYAGGAMAANHALRQSFVYLDLARAAGKLA